MDRQVSEGASPEAFGATVAPLKYQMTLKMHDEIRKKIASTRFGSDGFMQMSHVTKIAKFAVVSGTGLGLDFAVFLTLIWIGISTFSANVISGACAVTFVYFASCGIGLKPSRFYIR